MNVLSMIIYGSYLWQRKHHDTDESVFNTILIISFCFFLNIESILAIIGFLFSYKFTKSQFWEIPFVGMVAVYISLYYYLILKRKAKSILIKNRHHKKKCIIYFSCFSLASVIIIMSILYIMLLRNRGEISF